MSLLNRAKVKRHVLMIAHESRNTRLHKYERVSKASLDYLEARLLLEIRELVENQRTGITIKP
jgi:predicted RNase H-like nuclease